MRRWAPAHGWSVTAAEDGLSLTRNGFQTVVAVPHGAAHEALAAISGSLGEGDLSPEGRQAISLLDHQGVLIAELVHNHQVLARHEPTRRRARPEGRWARPARALPTTYLRAGPDGPEFADSRSGGRIVLTSTWAAEFSARLLSGADIDSDGDLAAGLLGLMSRAGLLASDEPEHDLSAWEFHDSVFHAGSRLDTSVGPYAGKSQVLGQSAAVPRPAIQDRVPLSQDEGTAQGVSLRNALWLRASVRDHAGPPIGCAELGAVLGGSLRVRHLDHGPTGQLAWRPIPTGGARSGLSAVVLAGLMSDLPRGAYEYDAVSHELAPATGPAAAIGRWLTLAERLTGIPAGSVQALILFTLDYARPAHAYNSIIYATALKEVGAALQTMALLSVDLGLSFCPMGGGLATTAGLGEGIRSAAVIGEAVLGRPSRDPYGKSP